MIEKQETERAGGMSPLETRAAFSLAGIFSLRMLGLFLIFPVFALYAEELSGVTPLLVGVAIGAYGLTQAFLQIPFGMLSDRVGRKPVIIGGLVIFAIGSVVAAQADTIWGVIFGRAIQGGGAIAAAVMALAADLSRDEHRTKVMATIGISIGFAFAIAMILGPILNSWIGVPGIFWLTAVLALAGIAIVLFLVPSPRESHFHRDTEPLPGQFGRVLSSPDLLRLDLGIMTLHMTLTAVFLAVPLALRDEAGLQADHHWMVYLPTLVLAMGLMIPFVVIAEKRRKMKTTFLGGVLALALGQGGFFLFYHSLVGITLSMLLYFTAFNLLEATLPSLIAKVAPAEAKGTAMGVYSTSQFVGAFLGGLIGGWMHTHYDLGGVFLFGVLAALLWFAFAYRMSRPAYLSSHILVLGEIDPARTKELQERLLEMDGVGDAFVVAEEGVAYLKIDREQVDMRELDAFSGG